MSKLKYKVVVITGARDFGGAGSMKNLETISPEAIARAIAFSIEQPAEVDVNELVVRPTAQS